ncbi:Gamma-aminobutyric acid type B receptor subunit 2 [Trichoplax sp. H2]|nr:Gamma-aminobutyric acid type B receptor subunit 2 [Trichoplax sp. H2]|eukprot:RDD41741.1 Gamma-aminobutyric acid type B receptor subunit 2 [Trichoplax sp. H2]
MSFQCDAGLGLKLLYDQVTTGTTKLAVFGSSCSVVTQQMARITPYYNLIQGLLPVMFTILGIITALSYLSSSPTLNSRDDYSTLYRTYPSETSISLARLELCRRYNWKKIAIISESLHVCSKTAQIMSQLAKAKKLEILAITEFGDREDPLQALKIIKKMKARIIMGGFTSTSALKVFCRAYHLNLTTPKYVWMIMGWFNSNWWKLDQENITVGNVSCTQAQIIQAIDGYFSNDGLQIYDQPLDTVSGLTPQEWNKLYNQEMAQKPLRHAIDDYGSFAYDGIWSLALMLDRSISYLKRQNLTLEGFRYKSNQSIVYRNTFQNILDHLKFKGITGPVSFHDGDRLGKITIKRFINQRNVIIGQFDDKTSNTTWNNSTDIDWKTQGNSVPTDWRTITITNLNVSEMVYMIVMIHVGLVFATSCILMAIYFYYRKEPPIATSNTILDLFMGFGTLLCLSYVGFLCLENGIVDPNNKILAFLCTFRSWLLAVGFSITLGCIFANSWSTYRSLSGRSYRLRKIKKSHSYGIAMSIFIFNIILCSLRATVDQVEIFNDTIWSQRQIQSDGDIFVPQVRICRFSKYIVWDAVIFGINGIILLFGAITAWQAQRIDITNSNYVRYLAITAYNLMISTSVAVTMSIVIVERPTVRFVLISFFIILSSLSTNCLTYLPKIHQMVKDRKGIRRKSFLITTGRSKTLSMVDGHAEFNLYNVETRKQQLLSKLENEIKDLTTKITEKDVVIERISKYINDFMKK